MQNAEETGAICRVIYMSVMRVHGYLGDRQLEWDAWMISWVNVGMCLSPYTGVYDRCGCSMDVPSRLTWISSMIGQAPASPRRCITGSMATRPFS